MAHERNFGQMPLNLQHLTWVPNFPPVWHPSRHPSRIISMNIVLFTGLKVWYLNYSAHGCCLINYSNTSSKVVCLLVKKADNEFSTARFYHATLWVSVVPAVCRYLCVTLSCCIQTDRDIRPYSWPDSPIILAFFSHPFYSVPRETLQQGS